MSLEIYDSELFGKLSRPSSFEDLLSLILDPPNKESPNVWMWRGQSDITWPIHSAAYRRLSLTKPEPTDWDIQYYEKILLKRATHGGFRFVNGRSLSDFELLAALQHHGAATRLLDATRSALIGLYFACNQLPTKVGALIGFHAHELGGYEGEPMEMTYKEFVEEFKSYKNAVTWQPSSVSPRIAAQHSQFIYSPVQASKSGSIKHDEDGKRFLCIPITPKLKKESLIVLSESFDIRDLTLFPDIDGFCRSNSVAQEQFAYARW